MGGLPTRLHHTKRVMRSVRLPVYQAAEQVLKNDQVTCKRGCTHCCYQAVALTFPEAVVARLEAGDDWWKAHSVEVERRAALWIRKTTRIEWLMSKTPCIFLDGIDCRIYDVRPITCATYMVVTDPELCSPDHPGGEVGYVDMKDIALPATADSIRRCADLGVPPAVMPMSVGLVLANCFVKGDVPAVIDCMRDWGLDVSSSESMYDALYRLIYDDQGKTE